MPPAKTAPAHYVVVTETRMQDGTCRLDIPTRVYSSLEEVTTVRDRDRAHWEVDLKYPVESIRMAGIERCDFHIAELRWVDVP